MDWVYIMTWILEEKWWIIDQCSVGGEGYVMMILSTITRVTKVMSLYLALCEGDGGYELILGTVMMVTKVMSWYLTPWWGWLRLYEWCSGTVVSITNVTCEWYLTIMITMYMMLIRKMKRDRYEWMRWHWSGIRVWIANGINRVPLVSTFLKLISQF